MSVVVRPRGSNPNSPCRPVLRIRPPRLVETPTACSGDPPRRRGEAWQVLGIASGSSIRGPKERTGPRQLVNGSGWPPPPDAREARRPPLLHREDGLLPRGGDPARRHDAERARAHRRVL